MSGGGLRLSIDLLQMARAIGADDTISKPFLPSELVRQGRGMLSRRAEPSAAAAGAAALAIAICRGDRPGTVRADLDRVVLDHGVGEQLLAHLLDRRRARGLSRLGELDLDEFALAHVADAAEAEIARAWAIALPCGSSTPVFRVMWTRAFMSLAHCAGATASSSEPLRSRGPAFGQDAEPAGDFLIGLLDPPRSWRKRSLSIFSLVFDVPQPAVVGADLVGEDDAHLVVLRRAGRTRA